MPAANNRTKHLRRLSVDRVRLDPPQAGSIAGFGGFEGERDGLWTIRRADRHGRVLRAKALLPRLNRVSTRRHIFQLEVAGSRRHGKVRVREHNKNARIQGWILHATGMASSGCEKVVTYGCSPASSERFHAWFHVAWGWDVCVVGSVFLNATGWFTVTASTRGTYMQPL